MARFKKDVKKLVEFLRSKGLKIKVEGPMDEAEGSMSFLKRNFRSTNEGDVEIAMNTKYVEGLLEVLKLEGAYPKRLPCQAVSIRQRKIASSEERRIGSVKRGGPRTFRKGVGILLYLARERPDIMYVLTKLRQS